MIEKISKQFKIIINLKISLIFPVLGELDDLKKSSDNVRNTIRWLEREFTKYNRFIRLQRDNESRPLTLIKVPKKLGKYFGNNSHFLFI